MQKFAMILLVSVTGITSASGATATFEPSDVVVAPGDPAVFDVTVAVDELTEFQGVDLLLGWDEPGDLTFSYSDEFRDAMAAFVVDPPQHGTGYYTNDVYVGGSNTTPVGTSVLVGAVTLDTTGLSAGTYDVRIDATTDQGFCVLSVGSLTEGIFGSATVTVTTGPPGGGGGSDGQDPDGGTLPDGDSDTNGHSSDDDGSGEPDDGGTNGVIDSGTIDNPPEGDGSGDSDDGNANDNAVDAGAADSDANTDDTPSRDGTAPRGLCGLGTLGAVPLSVAGLFLLQAPRRRRAK